MSLLNTRYHSKSPSTHYHINPLSFYISKTSPHINTKQIKLLFFKSNFSKKSANIQNTAVTMQPPGSNHLSNSTDTFAMLNQIQQMQPRPPHSSFAHSSNPAINLFAAAQNSSFMLDIKLRKLAFYENLFDLVKPTLMVPTNVLSRPLQFSFTFYIPEKYVQEIAASR